MAFSRIHDVILSCIAVVMLMTGCALLKDTIATGKTRIIAVPFGVTTHVTRFKVGVQKPYGHVIWGKEVRDGALCAIIITNVSRAIEVYRCDFTYNKSSIGKGYNIFRSRIVELDPKWHHHVGKYMLNFFVDGERISNDSFQILP